MRAILQALTSELRRLKASGVKTVNVSPEAIQALRIAARKHSARSPASAAEETGETAPPKSPFHPEATALRGTGAPAPPSKAAVSAPTSTLPPPPTLTLPSGDKTTQMAWLRERVLNDPVCRAHLRPDKRIVVGVGTLDAKLFFCGEAPGAEEEMVGEPFVGPSGQLLTRMIQAMGLKREEVYIGNIMNWRPDMETPPGQEQMGNRPPTPEELSYCLPFLRAQLEIVRPEIIVALGSTAAQGLFGVGSFKTLGEIRGRWKHFSDKPVMVTYHPSYILRSASNRSKRAIWEDLLQVMDRAGLPISEKQRGFFLDK